LELGVTGRARLGGLRRRQEGCCWNGCHVLIRMLLIFKGENIKRRSQSQAYKNLNLAADKHTAARVYKQCYRVYPCSSNATPPARRVHRFFLFRSLLASLLFSEFLMEDQDPVLNDFSCRLFLKKKSKVVCKNNLLLIISNKNSCTKSSRATQSQNGTLAH
jgi:hypothetical protein